MIRTHQNTRGKSCNNTDAFHLTATDSAFCTCKSRRARRIAGRSHCVRMHVLCRRLLGVFGHCGVSITFPSFSQRTNSSSWSTTKLGQKTKTRENDFVLPLTKKTRFMRQICGCVEVWSNSSVLPEKLLQTCRYQNKNETFSGADGVVSFVGPRRLNKWLVPTIVSVAIPCLIHVDNQTYLDTK